MACFCQVAPPLPPLSRPDSIPKYRRSRVDPRGLVQLIVSAMLTYVGYDPVRETSPITGKPALTTAPWRQCMKNSTAKVSQLIDCRMDEAFDAFVNPAKITQFWLDSTTAPLSKNSTAIWHFMVPGAVDKVTVDEFERPSLITFSWSDGSKVRLEFSKHSAGRTRVSAEFSLSADNAIEQVANTTEGFSIVLCDLKTLLESGRSANLVRAKAELIASSMAPPQGDA